MCDDKAAALAILLREVPRLSAGIGRIDHPVLAMMMRQIKTELKALAACQDFHPMTGDGARARSSDN